ncbi:amyloid-beta A4 precursor protein-binding family B member 3 isoform X4 [Trichosurus vulpecula]|uniref:amyloid-beta A4 precursor protein-binding family B member 3 isoform X4 n=1 Tax=Trichosurus vulpecula TaxID=9337 RepID=UPI00186AF74E|nr:amyloid-beta A4 precursor protein-binding family B member 3 isoform X4 [Trichosurus vulpecula]
MLSTCFWIRDRDFAFVAGDKDTCMLKCHVFRCDVPAKAIASALHGLCAQILSERAGVSGDPPRCSLDPISPEDLPRQVELLDAVSQAAQQYEALYVGTLPVSKAMGEELLGQGESPRHSWVEENGVDMGLEIRWEILKCLKSNCVKPEGLTLPPQPDDLYLLGHPAHFFSGPKVSQRARTPFLLKVSLRSTPRLPSLWTRIEAAMDVSPPGMDVLNEAIGALTSQGDHHSWAPTILSVSDSLMTALPIQGQAKLDAEEEPLWQCPVRHVTFIGVGHDPHTFGLIADLGHQRFQCAAFWCQPHAGALSEAVQAACMVQYQKCLVASAARGKARGAQARARLRLKRTSSVDSAGGPLPLPLPLLKGGVGGAGAAPRKRGVFSFFDSFRLKPSLLHMP